MQDIISDVQLDSQLVFRTYLPCYYYTQEYYENVELRSSRVIENRKHR